MGEGERGLAGEVREERGDACATPLTRHTSLGLINPDPCSPVFRSATSSMRRPLFRGWPSGVCVWWGGGGFTDHNDDQWRPSPRSPNPCTLCTPLPLPCPSPAHPLVSHRTPALGDVARLSITAPPLTLYFPKP